VVGYNESNCRQVYLNVLVPLKVPTAVKDSAERLATLVRQTISS